MAELLFSAHAPDEVIAAGLLHDTVEKSDMTVEDIRVRMGSRVAAIVAAVTEDPTIRDRPARKRALSAQVGRSDPAAALVYAADKIDKLAELRRTVARDGVEVLERPGKRAALVHYATSAQVVEQVLGRHPLVLRLQADLRAVAQYRSPAVS